MRDDQFHRGESGPDDWLDACPRSEGFGGPDILVVEDDDDIRELLLTLLELEGYRVTACASAERALGTLREQSFDFLLTDYALPKRTGGWLLQQARAEGLLSSTPVLVVTAHPNPPDVAGFEMMQKPFDLDELVARVRLRLDGSGDHGSQPAPSRAPAPPGRRRTAPKAVVELVLYVRPESPRSAAAIENIRNVLSRYRADAVSLTICDLASDPSLGDQDRIAFTPTLVRRSPGPRTFILGQIDDADVLRELLEGCDIES